MSFGGVTDTLYQALLFIISKFDNRVISDMGN